MKEAPQLSGIDRMTPFSVPRGYFEHLPQSLRERITPAAGGFPDLRVFFRDLRPAIAIASAILLFTALFFLIFRTSWNRPVPYDPDSAYYDELQSSLLDHMDDNTLLDAFTARDNAPTEEEIIDYLAQKPVSDILYDTNSIAQ